MTIATISLADVVSVCIAAAVAVAVVAINFTNVHKPHLYLVDDGGVFSVGPSNFQCFRL